MTQKKDTTPASKSAEKTATKPADSRKNDIPTESSSNIKPFVWLLLILGAVGGGLYWAKSNNLVEQTGETTTHPTKKKTAQAEIAASAPDMEPDTKPDAQTESLSAIDGSTSEDLFALMERHEKAKRIRLALREDINALESQFSQLSERMNAMQDSITALENAPEATAQSSDLNSEIADTLQNKLSVLTLRLKELQANYEQNNQRYAARLRMTQLLDIIADKTENGESYAREMQQIQQLALANNINSPALQTLATHAQTGAPSLALLMDEFNETLIAAIPVSLAAKEEHNFGDKVRSRLSHIVSIRRVEVESTDNSDEAQIARAEAELQMGNVNMALTHLEQLSEVPHQVFARWRQKAETFLQVHTALEQLKSTLVQPSAE